MKQLLLNLKKSSTNSFIILCSLFFLSACSGLDSHRSGNNTTSSSLANFLYPQKQTKIAPAKQIPQITLPAKIGLAFLPSKHWRGSALDSTAEFELLNKVKSRFSEYRFINDIKIIPSMYLRHHSLKNSSGFDTLSQVSRLHDVDLIALVSYDQLIQSQYNNASLLYWTIVGMYVIPGNENTVQTFVDTAVFDVRSKQLLLRAPGISKLTKLSTQVDVSRVMSRKSQHGFNLAFDDMITNLDTELLRFKAQVKAGKTVQIANLESYSAGGSINTWLIYLLMMLTFYKYQSKSIRLL